MPDYFFNQHFGEFIHLAQATIYKGAKEWMAHGHKHPSGTGSCECGRRRGNMQLI